MRGESSSSCFHQPGSPCAVPASPPPCHQAAHPHPAPIPWSRRTLRRSEPGPTELPSALHSPKIQRWPPKPLPFPAPQPSQTPCRSPATSAQLGLPLPPDLHPTFEQIHSKPADTPKAVSPSSCSQEAQPSLHSQTPSIPCNTAGLGPEPGFLEGDFDDFLISVFCRSST